MQTGWLSRILIFPIKSLDGAEVEQATILSTGALQGDREFALVDQQGKFVNGKRTAQVHGVRATFNLAQRTVSLRTATTAPVTFSLESDRAALAAWFSDYFGLPIQIIQNTEMGFPDDTAAPGATIVSTATLAAIADWFPDLDLVQIRHRFRTNLEISGVAPFWEDRLFSAADQPVPFQIGDVQFEGINPCQRCVVVLRDPTTGEAYPNFQKQFVEQRQATLPAWAARSRFNHFYKLAVNTRLPNSEAGKILRLADPIG